VLGWIERRITGRLVGRRRPALRPDAPKEHVWSIGIYSGSSPFELQPATKVRNPVLTAKAVSDVPASFVADPFMIRANGTWFMFFEVLNQKTRKGEIGLATSRDGMRWKYRQIVLAEPFHLSYPYVFCWQNEYFMVPESWYAGAVRLYKANDFPFGWTFVKELLKGPYFADSSLIHFSGQWWMFTDSSSGLANNVLRLYFSEDLYRPFLEHPQSPIISGNPHIARPAGRVIAYGGKVIRYAQDCDPMYGVQVRAFEGTELTASSYVERQVGKDPLLGPSGSGWNQEGMHHIDPQFLEDGSVLACVDGFWLRQRSTSL
jgi:hypothetical protein